MAGFAPATHNIYLDYAATTPVDTRVIQFMHPFWANEFGNPSSAHQDGQKAEFALETARIGLAKAFDVDPGEIIFTSGGTEADNLAIRGVVIRALEQRIIPHLLISAVEHPAVKNTALAMQRLGAELEILPVDKEGSVDPQLVKGKIRRNTVLVSIIYANNEIGTINPVDEIGWICREQGVLFHTDAVQAAVHQRISLTDQPIDLLSAGAHKFYGPKGVGFLVKKKEIQLIPSQSGGSQENGLRGGTHNVPLIAGMAEAYRLLQAEMGQYEEQIQLLRNVLIERVFESIGEVILTGSSEKRLGNHASFAFRGIEANQLLTALDLAGFSCSSGSACKTGNPKPSEILEAMGYGAEWASGSLRVTLGRHTTQDHVDQFCEQLPVIIGRLRKQGG